MASSALCDEVNLWGHYYGDTAKRGMFIVGRVHASSFTAEGYTQLGVATNPCAPRVACQNSLSRAALSHFHCARRLQAQILVSGARI